MKLELKHLAAYLPYNLEMKGLDGSIALLNCDSGISLGKYGIEWVLRTQKAKPILRPLSDLTKEIEVNGEKIIVQTLIDKVKRFVEPYQYIDGRYDIELNYETVNYSVNIDYFDGYKIVQILLQYHFDIFNLIPNGLAIDINTLNK